MTKLWRDPRWRAVTVAVVLVGISLGIWAAGWHEYVRPATLRAWLQDMGPAGGVALVLALAGAVIVGPVPTVPFSIALGMTYGLLWGSALAVVGGLLGALIAFYIARLGGREMVRRFAGQHALLHDACSDRMLFWLVLGLRLIPIVSFGLVSYAAGLTAMTARAFALATAVGMVPMTMLYAMLGSAAHVEQAWTVLAGVVALALILAIPTLARRYDIFGLRRYIDAQNAASRARSNHAQEPPAPD